MPSFQFIVEYDGSRYNGFQRQVGTDELLERQHEERHDDDNSSSSSSRKRPKQKKSSTTTNNNIRTVQSELERAISSWSGASVPALRMRSASRTDRGVHARHQVVAVDNVCCQDNDNDDMTTTTTTTTSSIGDSMMRMTRATNSRLPSDIVVVSPFSSCSATFEPRREAVFKRYSYTMRYRRKNDGDTTTTIDNIGGQFHLIRRTALHHGPCLYTCPWILHDDGMKELCQLLTGTHDFSPFVHKHERRKKNNTMTLHRFDVEPMINDSSNNNNNDNNIRTVRFQLQAQGFRRSMVRNLVGFVVEVCRRRAAASNRGEPPIIMDETTMERILWNTTTNKNQEEEEAKEDWVKAVPASGLCLEYVQY